MHRTKVRVATDVLDANETIARANRADFDRAGVRVVNLMSAPGAGKTALLERVLIDGLAGVRAGVLEGDVQGSLDADHRLSVGPRVGARYDQAAQRVQERTRGPWRFSRPAT